MTREEAINKWIVPAIKNTWNEKRCKEILEALEQEPCGDAISRQAVLDAIMSNCIWENEYNLTSSRIKKAVESLPPVTPTRKPLLEVLEEIKGEINQLDIRPEHVFVGSIDTWWNGALERCAEIIDNHIEKEKK